jgi:hypothetical protein
LNTRLCEVTRKGAVESLQKGHAASPETDSALQSHFRKAMQNHPIVLSCTKEFLEDAHPPQTDFTAMYPKKGPAESLQKDSTKSPDKALQSHFKNACRVPRQGPAESLQKCLQSPPTRPCIFPRKKTEISAQHLKAIYPCSYALTILTIVLYACIVITSDSRGFEHIDPQSRVLNYYFQ